MIGKVGGTPGHSVAIDVAPMRVQPYRHAANVPNQQGLLGWTHHAYGDVRFPVKQVLGPVGKHQLDHQLRVGIPQIRKNDRLVRVLGAEPHTPLDVAVRATLKGLGCL